MTIFPTHTEIIEIPSMESLRKEAYDLTQVMLSYGLPSIELRAMFVRQLELESRLEYLEAVMASMPEPGNEALGGPQRTMKAKIDEIRREIKSR